MSKLKIKINPNSYYHNFLVKRYGVNGALKVLQNSNLRYIMENSYIPRAQRVAKFA